MVMTYNPEVTRSKLVEGILHLFLFISGHMSNTSGAHSPVTCHMSNTSGAHSPVTCHTSGATLWSHVKYIRRSLWSHVTHPALIVVTCHTSGATLWSHVKYIRRSLWSHVTYIRRHILVTCHIHPAVTLPILTNSLFNKKSFFIRLHTVTSSHT